MSCVDKPEGDVPANMQGMVQGLWDQAYDKIKTFVEQNNASGKVTVTLKPNKATK